MGKPRANRRTRMVGSRERGLGGWIANIQGKARTKGGEGCAVRRRHEIALWEWRAAFRMMCKSRWTRWRGESRLLSICAGRD